MTNQSIITLGLGLDDLLVTQGLWFGEVDILSSVIPFIDKGDNFEKVRDRIAAILAFETQSQQTLATTAGKDPTLWKWRVFSERINTVEVLTQGDDKTPIVNIWYDNSNFDKSGSNMTTRQVTTSRYNIDIYCHAESIATSEGHNSGDELAAKLAHNTAKLLRNILMHDTYKYLLYQGVVESRWIADIRSFQPGSGSQPVERVSAVRIEFDVRHIETILLQDPSILEIVNVKMYHDPDGAVIAELEYS